MKKEAGYIFGFMVALFTLAVHGHWIGAGIAVGVAVIIFIIGE